MKMHAAAALPLLLLLLLLGCRRGHALDCYYCEYGTCAIPAKVTCSGLEVCNTETSKTGYYELKKKGCINPLACLAESSVTYLGIEVKTVNHCCITNLCNSSVAPRLSVLSGVAALLALLVTKVF